MSTLPLRGFTVGVTADRRGEDQAVMLRRSGVDVILGPSMATLPPADESVLRAVTAAMVTDPPDDLVANTGFGIRTWLALAEGWGYKEGLLEALERHTRIAARGPKAVGALRSAGLSVWWRAPDEQLATVGRHLVEAGVKGRTVAVQLHGDDRQTVTALLRQAGAVVTEIPVYRWDLPPDAHGAAQIVAAAVDGSLDAVTFTAGPQIRNLMTIARRLDLAEEFVEACAGRVVVACVGPVCAAVATEEGLRRSLVPEQWRLGSLVRALTERLASRRWMLTWDGRSGVIQGRLMVIDDREIALDSAQRALLETLHETGDRPLEADPDRLAGLQALLGPLGGALEETDGGWRLAPGAVGRAPQEAVASPSV